MKYMLLFHLHTHCQMKFQEDCGAPTFKQVSLMPGNQLRPDVQTTRS